MTLLPEILENIPLAPFTTIGIGGPARYFARATSVDGILAAVRWAEKRDLPLFILGGGSNLLVSDDGFPGLVLRIELRGVTLESSDESALVQVAAGESWDGFVAHAVERRWAGIECLSGIPGSTGATPIQNVGAYGQEVSDTIVRVEAIDRPSGSVVWLTNEECRFGYRSSRFKNEEPGRWIVTAVTFRLQPGGEAAIRYPELQKQLEESGTEAADLPGVRRAVIAIRKRKGMVIDPEDSDTRSDGSFFMNPVVSCREYEAFARIAPDAPHFPAGDAVKLSAAWLIEQAGFHKGHQLGRAGLSTKHTLAVINRGNATAGEILELVGRIQNAVREKFGIELHPEPNFIGF